MLLWPQLSGLSRPIRTFDRRGWVLGLHEVRRALAWGAQGPTKGSCLFSFFLLFFFFIFCSLFFFFVFFCVTPGLRRTSAYHPKVCVRQPSGGRSSPDISLGTGLGPNVLHRNGHETGAPSRARWHATRHLKMRRSRTVIETQIIQKDLADAAGSAPVVESYFVAKLRWPFAAHNDVREILGQEAHGNGAIADSQRRSRRARPLPPVSSC